MKHWDYSSAGFFKRLSTFSRGRQSSAEVEEAVRAILADVRERGDAAVADCIRKFDHAELKPSRFRVGADEMAAAAKSLRPAAKKAIREAIASVKEFGRHGLPRAWQSKNGHGASVGERFHPIPRVGLYIPGGRVPLVSTVIMTGVLARLARVPEIAAFTPCGRDGSVSPEILATLGMIGIEEVYRVGGAQAIGAMTHGTKTIPAVDKIYGPGNAYVVEAKRQVFGRVGVDLLPGPSEVMVIADETARADWVAADLLAQAEHGANGRIYLVTTGRELVGAVEDELAKQAASLAHADVLKAALREGILAVTVADTAQAVEVANFVAPEHLELHLEAAAVKQCLAGVTTAGCIMAGAHTPTVLGDFTAGPSHVLPTGRSGRFSSGLRVSDFLRKTSFVSYNETNLRRAWPTVKAFSEMEQLDAHGRSASIRLDAADS